MLSMNLKSVLVVFSIMMFPCLATNLDQLRVTLNVATVNCLPDPLTSCSGHGICVNNGTYGFYCKCDNKIVWKWTHLFELLTSFCVVR